MSEPSGDIRVLVCDDVPEMRALLREVIEAEPGLDVVGEAATGTEAVRAISALAPDIVLLDLSMPEMDGLEAIEIIAKSSPDTGIVVFSGFEAGRLAALTRERGADAYVEKGEPFEALFAAVREAMAGRRRDGGGGAGSGPGSGDGAITRQAGRVWERARRLVAGSFAAA